MKTIIQIHREEKYFVAVDLLTNVADQGLTEEEAVANFKKGLEERKLLVTVPNHPELAKGTLISIMKQAKIKREEFLSKLK